MAFKSKTTQLIAKMVRLTSEDLIIWEEKDPTPSITRGSDDVVPIFFKAKYKDKIFAIFKRRTQQYYGETDSFYWNEGIVFSVLNTGGRVIWESSENSPAMLDLFETVSEKAAGIDGLLDDLLDD